MADTRTKLSSRLQHLGAMSQNHLQQRSHYQHHRSSRYDCSGAIRESGAIRKSRRPRQQHHRHRQQSGSAVRRVKDDEKIVVHNFPPDHLTSFQRELSVFSAVQRIPRLARHAPQLVKYDPDSRTIVLRQPLIHWTPLYQRAEAANLDVSTLLELKQKLQSYVSLLYDHGVVYGVKPECVFLTRDSSSSWMLYLGGWKYATLCPVSDGPQSKGWNKEMVAQLDEVEHLFAPLEAAAHYRQLEKGPQDAAKAAAAMQTLSLRDNEEAKSRDEVS